MKEQEDDCGNIVIAQNLDIALRHLRSNTHSRPIRIDALCINQLDDNEKSNQVARMSSIYPLASNVVIWLGPEMDKSSEALDLMQHLCSHVEMDWDRGELRKSATTDDPSWAVKHTPLPFKAGELGPISRLLNRPYFTRTWVRQEVALAKHAVVQCGRQQLSWGEFRIATALLYIKQYFFIALEETELPAFVRGRHAAWALCNSLATMERLMYIKFTFRDTACRDPRDRLFAVLSILSKEDRRLGIAADYTKETEEVYIDVARRFLSIKHSLDLFESCDLSSRKIEVPSWVPDWSTRSRTRRPGFTIWSACGWISAQVDFMSNNQLRTTGVTQGIIEKTYETIFDEVSNDMVQALRRLRTACGYANTSPDTASNLISAYCKALTAGEVAEAWLHPHKDYKTLEDCRKVLEMVWSSAASVDELSRQIIPERGIPADLSQLTNYLDGRSIFHLSDGNIGLGPIGAQPGDCVCVLLGCRVPVVLRPVSTPMSNQTWQLVGPCYVPDLANGEAIYRGKLSRNYRYVQHEYGELERVAGASIAVYDPETEKLKTDPAAILEEAGIKVEKHQREPHILEVLPESLRAAGVDLEDFILV